ncbi:MAG: SET domain-containing protein-lysine N-methyltransferase [Herminiimonas sp.]|nr:SET domain-containing protein-lysine N-methyltransferase [Herminiimonas sp.]
MTASSDLTDSPTDAPYRVKNSSIHGRGVFARRKIRAGTLLIEYTGDRISYDQACEDAAARDDESNHTFLFSLEDGSVIDGGSNGNDARWINHCCEPNCAAREEEGRIFIHALRDVARGEELNYDYGLVLDERYTPALKRSYACRCGTPGCRQTMLAPKRKRKAG